MPGIVPVFLVGTHECGDEKIGTKYNTKKKKRWQPTTASHLQVASLGNVCLEDVLLSVVGGRMKVDHLSPIVLRHRKNGRHLPRLFRTFSEPGGGGGGVEESRRTRQGHRYKTISAKETKRLYSSIWCMRQKQGQARRQGVQPKHRNDEERTERSAKNSTRNSIQTGHTDRPASQCGSKRIR